MIGEKVAGQNPHPLAHAPAVVVLRHQAIEVDEFGIARVLVLISQILQPFAVKSLQKTVDFPRQRLRAYCRRISRQNA